MDIFEYKGKKYRKELCKKNYDDLLGNKSHHCKSVDGVSCSFYNDENWNNEECIDLINHKIIPDCVNWDSIKGKTDYEFYTFHEINEP